MRGFVITALAVSLAVAGGLVGMGLASGSGAAWPTYRNAGIELQYPPGWQATNYSDDVGNEAYSLVFLSNQAMHDPCHISANEKSCGNVIGRIRPGGILVEWFAWAFPGWRYLNGGPGAFFIDGHPARILHSGATACRGLGVGAHEAVDVGVRSALDGFIFTACYKGPDSPILQRQMAEILHSTQFLEPVQ